MFCSLHNEVKHLEIWTSIQYASYEIDGAITEPGRELMELKYLQKDEYICERLAHACVAFASDRNHAERLAKYISKGWFMFATPLLANAGTSRGLPISCFLNYVGDSREELASHYAENIWLSTLGGGIGSHWSDVRSVGESTSSGSETSGIIPFLNVADAQVRAFKQGKTRQGAYAAYLDVSHPEIMEYLSIRSSDGGDQSRKSFHIHVGVNLTNEFMGAVEIDDLWDLIDPHSGDIKETVRARDIWSAIIKRRMADRGEPYLFFSDRAKEQSSYTEVDRGDINGSNLCTEITLATSPDKTAVCCLSSLNAAKYHEWVWDEQFIVDIVVMLDNALTVFINQAPNELSKAVASAKWERSIGIGVMGLHTLMQQTRQPFTSHGNLFCHVQACADNASWELGIERGVPDAAGHIDRRNTHLLAIAPNASSSIMLGVSPGVEPYRSNVYTVVQGSLMFEIKNPELDWLITDSCLDYEECWDEIRNAGGSVQSVDWLTSEEKQVFLTASEIDQRVIVDAARVRQLHICQAQSLNLFFKADADPKYVNEVHLRAWREEGVGVPLKSLYYCRTDVATKVESMGTQAVREDISDGYVPIEVGRTEEEISLARDYQLATGEVVLPGASCSIENKDECLACQG